MYAFKLHFGIERTQQNSEDKNTNLMFKRLGCKEGFYLLFKAIINDSKN
jgi:hypothetical protein